MSELIRDIYDDGYFEGTVDGHDKNIVLKPEEGSVYVSDDDDQDDDQQDDDDDQDD